MSHIDFEDASVLIVSGKGGKRRKVFPCPEFFAAMKAWYEQRATMNCSHDYVFAADRARRVSYDTLGKMLHDGKALAGLRHVEFTAHSLRHNWGTYLHKNGMPLKAVSLALGHSDLRTTAIYLHADDEDVRAMAYLPPRVAVTAPPALPTAPAATGRTAPVPSPAPLPPPKSVRPRVPLWQRA
jgi:integrase/recombinase XerD